MEPCIPDVDIKTFLRSIPHGSEVTICVRSLTSLTLIIFGIALYIDAIFHSRMEPFLGLGSVIMFTGEELRM
jgi:hypothetical protein